MIQIVHQEEQHYIVYDADESIGCVDVSQNPYHNQHRYLNLGLVRYDPAIAAALFHRLRAEVAYPLQVMLYASSQYDCCCKMLFHYYRETHCAVSPLTADEESFCADLPGTAFCCMEDGKIIHFAFVEVDEENDEIAYVGTIKPAAFQPFAASLVTALFKERDCITIECDDVDPAAMTVKSLFRPVEQPPYDTYLLD